MTYLEPQRCLACGYVCDATAGVDRPMRPHPGALAICIRCGHVAAFDANMRFRELTAAELKWTAADQNIRLVRKAIRDLEFDRFQTPRGQLQ